jgi:hypothetical protein
MSYRDRTAAIVVKNKEQHPELYCPYRRCLWKTGGGFCPRHRPMNTIKVRCDLCEAWYDERDVTFQDIEEDIQGADILMFVCPKGHRERKSRRIG